jgi:DNA-binding phage protein
MRLGKKTEEMRRLAEQALEDGEENVAIAWAILAVVARLRELKSTTGDVAVATDDVARAVEDTGHRF